MLANGATTLWETWAEPGSVYSEGQFLSQEDRRGYVGDIQSYEGRYNQTTLFVQGEYYYG